MFFICLVWVGLSFLGIELGVYSFWVGIYGLCSCLELCSFGLVFVECGWGLFGYCSEL